jgi:hypothetical protein
MNSTHHKRSHDKENMEINIQYKKPKMEMELDIPNDWLEALKNEIKKEYFLKVSFA